MKRAVIFGCFWLSLLTIDAQDLQLIVPTGHTRRVAAVELSTDLKWLATADGSNVVKIWRFNDRKEFYHLQHPDPIYTAKFTIDNQYLITGDQEGFLYVWADGGDLRQTVELSGGKVKQILALDSSVIAITSEQISIVDFTQGKVIKNIAPPFGSLSAGALIGNAIIVGSDKGEIAIIGLAGSKTKTKTVSKTRISTISISKKQEVFIGTDAGELIRFNISSMEYEVTQPFSLRNYKVVLDGANDRIIACGRDKSENLQVIDPENLKALDAEIKIDQDVSSEAFQFGLRAMSVANDSLLLIADYNQDIQVFHLKKKMWLEPFTGKAGAIYDLAVDRTGSWLTIAGEYAQLKVLNLRGLEADRLLSTSTSGSRAVDFHPVNPVVAVYGMDEKIRVINAMNDHQIFELKAKGKYHSTPVTFDPSGNYILRKSSESDFDFYNFKNKAPRNLKVKDGRKYVFSSDGRKLIFSTAEGLSVFDAVTHQELKEVKLENIQDLAMSETGTLAVLMRDDFTVKLYNPKFNPIGSISLESRSDKIVWTPDNEFLVGTRNSVSRGESGADFSIKLMKASTGKLAAKWPGHSGFVTDMEYINGYLLTAAIDGQIKIWDPEKENLPKGMIIPLENDQYVVMTPQGLFDATPAAMQAMHYIKQGKVIALDQLKSSYYEPNLLSKLLEYNEEPIRQAANLSDIHLYPELSIKHPLKNDGKLGINLNANGGGIGRVVILINGKEVSGDVRSASTPSASSLEINYDITNHPFLYPDKVSKVTIMAYNADGTLSSDAKSLYVFGQKNETVQPKLYAIIAGTSDYEGDDLDLKYAAKDAQDLASAIELGGSAYLGVENTSITLLTTDQERSQWPTKENIQRAFENYSTQATANDLLLVYLSGHGVNKGGENSDFYYLTCTASDGDLNNSVQRENAAISSAEFTSYINSVPALKQILIIDACHSGRLASSLASSRSAMSSTQIRALERMKDRTGMFVLAGSAADAVSYETTLYGQGLLTYSLLFGMKGAALRDDGFVDVLSLFQFAANKVPELAKEIGGIQKPEIRMPEDGKSFDIGRLAPAEREKINIKAPKPVFVHTRFQDESAIYDPLKISDLMDSKLVEVSSEQDAPIVFVDDKDFSGATIINGRYTASESLLSASIALIQSGKKVAEFSLEAINEDQLTEELIKKILSMETTE